MSKTIFTDRSRIETHQRCARLRWLEYHQDGTGIVSAKKPLPLAVGGSGHKGLEHLLRGSNIDLAAHGLDLEEHAVAAALADFATHRAALALDTTEAAAMSAVIDPKDAGFPAQLTATALDLGMSPDDPALADLLGRQRNAAAEFDAWLFNEQSALVEAMVRAYARRRLRPLLEEFEVLEVEREGDWELARWKRHDIYNEEYGDDWELRFMSRPDALLRSRADNSLYILSFKTAASWDIRKARDAEHDMQGLSEGVEVERRLGQWWQDLQYCQAKEVSDTIAYALHTKQASPAMVAYLRDLPAPPRILGIRYEYMLKGSRWEDKDLTRRFGLTVWSQRSHLIRRYVAHSTPSRGKNASSFDIGSSAWSWDYHLEDGSTSKLSASNWHSEPVWESGSVKAWIDLLNDTQQAMSAYDSTTGAEPRELGWKGAAQSLGYTSQHPLDAIFVPPLTVYRQDDQLRDWVEQVEAQEQRVAEAVAQVDAAADDGERRHLLNVLMPMSRRSCSYPTECPMTKVCYGGDDIRTAPLDSGLYRRRVANHPQENSAATAVVAEDL